MEVIVEVEDVEASLKYMNPSHGINPPQPLTQQVINQIVMRENGSSDIMMLNKTSMVLIYSANCS